MRLLEPVIRIPKLEICDILSVEINEDTQNDETMAVNGNEQNCYATNEQMDITDPNVTDTDTNSTENHILFEHYFCITSKERNGVTAVCNFCKDAKGLRGGKTNNMRFVKHLEVCTLQCTVEKVVFDSISSKKQIFVYFW